MDLRQLAALLIACLTLGAVVLAYMYATREQRAERRGWKRSLRRSRQRAAERRANGA
jgi:Flp pilus assembly protein TadB